MISYRFADRRSVGASRHGVKALLLWMLVVACGGEGAPDAERPLGAAEADGSASGDRRNGQDGDGFWGLGALELVGPVRSFEAFNDSRDGYFADLLTVEPLDAGGVLAVDRLLPAVLLLDESGDVLSRKGRRGSGPGEFGEAAAASASDSSAWVIDHRNGWLQPYKVEADSLRSLDPVRPPFLPEGTGPGCLSDRGLWVSGLYSGRLLHVLGTDGFPRQSIGDPFGPPNAPSTVAEFVSRGPITCSSRGDVVVASCPLGVVRFYTSNGSLAWEVDLPDFNAQEVAANDRGGVSLTAPEGPGGARLVEDLVVTVWAAAGFVGVQFGDATQFRGSWRDFDRVRTVLLDRETGELLAFGDELPRIDLLQGEFAIAHGNSPVPGVRVYRWSWRSVAGG